MMVRATDGSETLLKHALPVPRASGEPVARLTRRPVPLAARQLRDFNPGPTHHDGSLLSIPGRANELIIFFYFRTGLGLVIFVIFVIPSVCTRTSPIN